MLQHVTTTHQIHWRTSLKLLVIPFDWFEHLQSKNLENKPSYCYFARRVAMITRPPERRASKWSGEKPVGICQRKIRSAASNEKAGLPSFCVHISFRVGAQGDIFFASNPPLKKKTVGQDVGNIGHMGVFWPSSQKEDWWLNQPIGKICSSKWVHLPQIGMKIKNI